MSPKYDPNLEKYLKEYQENPRSRVFAPLAEAYRKSGLIDEAMDICREGLEYHPNFTSGIVALARCYFDKALYTAAIKELEKVVSEVPDNYLAQKLLAQSYSMIGDKNNSLKSYKTVLFLNPKDEESKRVIAEMEGSVEKAPDSFLPDEHQEKDSYYIPPVPNFDPPEFANLDAEEEESLKFQEKPANLAFKKEDAPTELDAEKILTELSTMTMGELLESQGLKEKAAEVYRKLLSIDPDNSILKEKLNKVEEELGLTSLSDTELGEHDTIEDAKSEPEEFHGPYPEEAPIMEQIYSVEAAAPIQEAPEKEDHELNDIYDDKWLLGEPVSENDKLKKLYALLEGITKYKALHSR